MKVQKSGETRPKKSLDQVQPTGNYDGTTHRKELKKTDCDILKIELKIQNITVICKYLIASW